SKVPLVLCSGIACDDVHWSFLAPDMGAERMVITWDYPYHGDSGPAADPDNIGLDSLSHHAAALLESLQLDEVVVAAHSMGTQVMFELYRREPSKVRALISIAGSFGHTVGHLYGTQIGTRMLDLLQLGVRLNATAAALAWRIGSTPAFADRFGRALGLIGSGAPVDLMARYFHHVGSMDPDALFRMFREGQNHSAEDLLPNIDVPVLILHGRRDVMTPIQLAEKMNELIPDARLVAFESGAHTLPIEEPVAISQEITAFLAECVEAQQVARD
ncbi:MAG TPA: alpha/beta hydrolase, partial [Actinomycetota bacterium]|nr:alpha/beta hydrolase [Actinomycetota bacterium]